MSQQLASSDSPLWSSTTSSADAGSSADVELASEPAWYRPGRDHVTAILVAHDGARWLPAALRALRAQTRAPDRIIAVDTGSVDATPKLLATALGANAVRTLPGDTGFGAAVRAAVDVLSPVAGAESTRSWLWLLHDDCAPAPSALEALLRTAHGLPSAGILGPKLRGWRDGARLMEIGITTTRSGRRVTGLEPDEVDQGQHDGVRNVLAVNSAGMLVRRDVWDRLGGFDPALPLFRDDLDLGWRAQLAGTSVVCATDSVVQHLAAGSEGRRDLPAVQDRAERADRRAAAYLLLANLPAVAVPLTLLRLGLSALARAAAELLAKRPPSAAAALAGFFGVVGRPAHLTAARRTRRALRVTTNGAVRPLLARSAPQPRVATDALSALASRLSLARSRTGAPASGYVEPGAIADDAVDLPDSRGGWRRVLGRPAAVLAVGLGLVSLLAARGVAGSGRLLGGSLLPAPDGVSDVWQAYAASWHDVGLGSSAAAPPYLAVVAILGTVLTGKAWLVVDLLVLGCPVLAGLSAYVALGAVVRARGLRLWGAATYATLPAITATVAGGRLGTAVATAMLPLVGFAAYRSLRGPGGRGSWAATWAAGLALAVTAAFAPLAWVLAVVVGLGAAVAIRTVAAARRLLVMLLVPVAVLTPWLPRLGDEPGLLLLEIGLAQPVSADAAWRAVLADPGWPAGSQPVALRWVTVGVLLAALAALLRRSRAGVTLAAWLVALLGISVTLLLGRIEVAVPWAAAPVSPYPGVAAALTGAGLVVAAAVGAEGVVARIKDSSFGLRQLVTVALIAYAAAVPLLAATSWVVRGAAGPLERSPPDPLPAFVVAEAARPDAPRTLVLRGSPTGGVEYAVVGTTGPRLGDSEHWSRSPSRSSLARRLGRSEVAPPVDAGGLDDVVTGLLSGRGGDDAAALPSYAVRFVLAAAPVDPDVAAALDADPGLRRVSSPEAAALWAVPSEEVARTPSARLRLLDADGGATAVPWSGSETVAELAPGAADRELVLSVLADPGWRAELAGQPLRSGEPVDGWAQAFAMPDTGGELVVSHDPWVRRRLLLLQAVLVGIAVVLALPTRRAKPVESGGDVLSSAPPVPAGPVDPALPRIGIRGARR